MSQVSSSNVSLQDPPMVPPDSPGSSVSTRLQEEYDELLKYAVVVPEYNSREIHGALSEPCGAFQGREKDIITIHATHSQPPGTDGLQRKESVKDGLQRKESVKESGEKTPQRKTSQPRSSVEQLPDFRQSPISLQSSTRTSSFTERLKTASNSGEIGGGADDLSGSRTFVNGAFTEAGWDREVKETVYKTTIDPDVGKMETLMDQWSLDLKRNVLAEFSQAKLVIEQRCREELLRETNRHAKEKAELIQELDSMKEFLHTYQQTMERKDSIIANLTSGVYRQRDKTKLMRNFYIWRMQHTEIKRENFALQLARKQHERALKRRVLSAWFSVIHSKWRQRVEKACQVKAQEVCLQLTADYEAKIASLNEALEATRKEVQYLQIQREKYEEAMKKAFMRGVCALNMEAMSIFHGEKSDEGPEQDPRRSDQGCGTEDLSNNFDSFIPDKAPAAYKSIPKEGGRDSATTDAPLPRIVTSQGTRPVTTSTAPRPTSAKSSTATTASHKSRVSSKVSAKSGSVGRSTSPSHATVASVVVERHHPVNKQTIGQATASRFQKPPGDGDKFRRLAGQDGLGKAPSVQTVRVVD